MDKHSIAFLGTPEISATLLKGLVESGFSIQLVVTKEDKVRGRNNRIEESPVAKMAHSLSLPCYKPHRLNKEHDFLLDGVDLLLTFAYGQILSPEVLSLSRYKPLNLHASLLPLYRGAAPIQYAIRNGEKKTGITLMEMVKEMDAGDIYAQEELPIEESDDTTSLSRKLATLALEVCNNYLPLYFENRLVPRKQDEGKVSFAPSIKKEEEKLILDQNPDSFVNQVRSLSEEPGGHLLLGEEILKIYKAHKVSDETKGEVGKILLAHKNEILLQLKGGIVSLDMLQRPGKKRLTAQQFNNGLSLEGKVLR